MGIALWLKSIYGSLATGVALILLSPIVFIGQGIHTIVPSNMALGIAFLLWAVIIKKSKNSGLYLFAGTLCLILLHQVGKIYSLIAICLFVFRSGLAISKRDLTLIIVSTIVVLASLAAPSLIHRPELNFDPVDFFPGEWNSWTAFWGSLDGSFRSVNVFLQSLNSAFIPIFAMTVGFLSMDLARRRIWAVIALLLTGLLISSMFYVVPWFGQLVFERAWVPLVLFLFGLIGFALVSSIQKVSESVKIMSVPFVERLVSIKFFVSYITILLVLFSMTTYIPFYSRHYFLTLGSTIDNPSSFFNSAQPEMIFKNLPENHRVLYTTEVALYTYLTYGGLHHGAIFYPAIKGTNEEKSWIDQKVSQIDFIVAGNEENLSDLASELMLEVEILDNQGITVLARVIH
jgi:hypothetical protein